MYGIDDDLTRPMEGYVDKPSGQLLNDEVNITQLGRKRTRNNEPFDRQIAEEEMHKHLRRKRRGAPVKFLVDRMRFTKRGYHEYLPYRDIKHFYQPDDQSNAFVLFIRDRKGRDTYETYKCDNPSEVARVKELINCAGNDRQKMLGSTQSLYHSSRPSSRVSNASSEYSVYTKSASRSSRPSSAVRLSRYEVYYPSVQPSQQPLRVYERRVSRPISVEPKYEYRWASTPYLYVPPDTSSVTAQQSYISQQSVSSLRSVNDDPSDYTFIRSDSTHGTDITEDGPIYMYMSRSQSGLRYQ
ncbi:hypothetical protein FBUS_04109 [Fasciolopsis buskii]|uniref:Trematode PH-like domain-containing protein n=1 Tax=Fasciolopsis buskii TaxID=27845 RepID=A0A8E0RVS2_9TREM|nr:hypothetical protein FBUS_04109 [Fasciolopsis buski]